MNLLSDVLQALCGVVREGRDVERCAAAQALGALRQEDGIDALLEALQDEDEDVRADAAEALNDIGHPRAGPALLESLVQDPVGEVKLAAAAALGHLKHGAAVRVLRGLVRGRDGQVVWDEDEFLSGGWDDWLDVQVKAIEALSEMGAAEAVPDIVAAIQDEMGQDIGPAASRALAGLGQAGLTALAAVLRSGEERQRRQAADALRDHGSQAASETLAIALDDPCADIRCTVLNALAAQNPGDTRLSTLFADPDPAVRAAAVRLAGRHWPAQLDRLLDDPSEAVQAEVVRLLAAEGALPDMTDLAFRVRVKMRGPFEAVAAAACQAIVRIAPEDALPDLSEQLHDGNCPAAVRRAAARGLARLGSGKAVAAHSAAVDDDHKEIRTETVAALADIAQSGPMSSAASGVLVKALRGELVPPPEVSDPPEKTMADSRSAPPQASPEGPDEDGAPPAAEAPWPTSTLQAITGDSADPAGTPTPQSVELDESDLALLALATKRPWKKHVSLNPPVVLHEDVRRLAALALGEVALAEVAEALADQLGDPDPELRRRAAESLGRVGHALGGLRPSLRERLLGVLEDQDRDLRLAAVRALAATSEEAVAALSGCLGDSDSFVRAEAARTLAALGAAPESLSGLLADDYPGVRLAAAEAIAKQGDGPALSQLLDFAFAFGGMHAAEVAALLRDLDRPSATGQLLATLDDPEQRRKWRIAIDILKDLNHPGREAPPRLVA
jgi:HEAT repeat protein